MSSRAATENRARGPKVAREETSEFNAISARQNGTWPPNWHKASTTGSRLGKWGKQLTGRCLRRSLPLLLPGMQVELSMCLSAL